MTPTPDDIERARRSIHELVAEHVRATLKTAAPGMKEPARDAAAVNLAIKLSRALAEKVALGELAAAKGRHLSGYLARVKRTNQEA